MPFFNANTFKQFVAEFETFHESLEAFQNTVGSHLDTLVSQSWTSYTDVGMSFLLFITLIYFMIRLFRELAGKTIKIFLLGGVE